MINENTPGHEYIMGKTIQEEIAWTTSLGARTRNSHRRL